MNENPVSKPMVFSGSRNQSIVFQVPGQEMMRLDGNGDFYIRGKLITNDLEIVDGMRQFLSQGGFIK